MALYPAHSLPALARPPLVGVSRRGVLAGAAATAAGPLLLAGCGDGTSTGRSQQAFDEVTYITGLGATGRESYVWVADAKGYFAEEGIKVKIRQGQAGDRNIQALVAGQAQFVCSDYAGHLVRVGAGNADDRLRAIGVIHNKTVMSIMTLDSNVDDPKDLAGKRLGHPAGSAIRAVFPAYARVAGLSETQIRSIRWQDTQGSQLPQLLVSGRLDGIGQMVPGAPTVQAAAGRPVTVLPYSTFLGDLYGVVIVTREGVDRGLQRRFMRALHKGLLYCVDHADETGQILHAAVATASAEDAAAEVKLIKPYVGSARADSILVARSIALMQSIGMFPQTSTDPERVFDFDIMGDAAGKATDGGSR